MLKQPKEQQKEPLIALETQMKIVIILKTFFFRDIK